MRFCLLCAILMIATTLAHAAGCTRPEKPRFPDPKTVAPEAVQRLDAAMQKYSAGMNGYVACLSKEAEAAQAEGTKTITFYNDDFLAEYNKRAAR